MIGANLREAAMVGNAAAQIGIEFLVNILQARGNPLTCIAHYSSLKNSKCGTRGLTEISLTCLLT